MVYPLPHNPHPRPRLNVPTVPHEVCVRWATVALWHMRAAAEERGAARDRDTRDKASRRILDARAVYHEFVL